VRGAGTSTPVPALEDTMPDTRTDPPFTADEWPMLQAWLELQRATLMWKCEGLSQEQLRQRSVPPSTLSPLGLVRHMTEVERHWFRRILAGEDAPPLYSSETDRDADFDGVDAADPATAFASWEGECAHARALVEERRSLEALSARPWRGAAVSLRWILVHMIEEYARHNGHADLLRERIDGMVGY